MDYTKVTVYTNAEGVDLVCGIFYDMGIQGVQIMDKADFLEFVKNNLRAWDIVDEELSSSMMSQETTVTAFLNEEDKPSLILEQIGKALEELGESGDFGRLKVETEAVKDEDWANNWKKYYKPLRIGDHIIIKPTWEDFLSGEGDVVVELDPGMAFGTGSHASTHMCLEFLEKTVKKGDTVLDIGTGSGILGIAALKLGAKSVTAVDIDPLAVKIAKENAEKNGYTENEFRALSGDLTDKVTGTYDVVIANIVADIIVELTKDVRSYVKNGGTFITSGIIDFKAEKVRDAVLKADFKINQEKEQDDWHALLCERES